METMSPTNVDDNVMSPPADIDSQSDIELFEEDNAEDLAALMAASSTIQSVPRGRQQSGSRKYTRQQRDMENMMKLLAPDLIESDPLRDDRENALVQLYLGRVQALTKDDPEIFKNFIKLFYEFGQSDRTVLQLHKDVCQLFKNYPDLRDEFAMFLLPEQAIECGQYIQHIQFNRMRLFLRKVEVHFSKHPQHIQKILKVLIQCKQEAHQGMDHIKSLLQPVFRNQYHLMEEFLQLFPKESPPACLMTEFEDVDLPDSDVEEDNDGFEVVTLVDKEEEYGGKNCKCDCHISTEDPKMHNRIRHCFSCGIKFIDGRIYVQAGKGLKPVQVTYINPSDKEYVLRRRSAAISSHELTVSVGPTIVVDPLKSSQAASNPASPSFESSSVSSLSPGGTKDSEEEKEACSDAHLAKNRDKPAISEANSSSNALKIAMQKTAMTGTVLASSVPVSETITSLCAINSDHPLDFNCTINHDVQMTTERLPELDASVGCNVTIQSTCSPSRTTTTASVGLESKQGLHCISSQQSKADPVGLAPNISQALEDKYESSLQDRESLDLHSSGISAKNHLLDEKGEIIVVWTREADRLILSTCQQLGATDAAFERISELLKKPQHEVRKRLSELIRLFSEHATLTGRKGDTEVKNPMPTI